MSTGLFADEEDGYNIEETKYKLKVDNPESTEPDTFMSDDGEDMGDLDDVLDDADTSDGEGGDKPFDDEPFDAGVEADEDTDPEKYIQQLSGKLGQTLRKYTDDEGKPNFDLEKFAVNSVLSATHTAEMDDEDQEDIIKKVKSAGRGEFDGEDNDDVDLDIEDDSLGDDEPVEESTYDDNETTISMNTFVETLNVNDKIGKFVDEEKIIKNLRLMEISEPLIEPKPITKPSIKPSRPMREIDRPFLPKRRTKTRPKANDNDIINIDEDE